MKKFFSFAIALCLCLSVLCIPALAAETIHEGTIDDLTWALDEDGVLLISGTGEMQLSNSSPWYSYRNDIKSVIIEDGVTSIGNRAFYGCTNLTDVSIPDSVTYLGEYAFSGCTSLVTVDIPASITEIGDWAFSSCSSLTSIPASMSCIGNYMFYGCSGLIDIVIPEGVEKIGESAFVRCTYLRTVSIPDSVTTIGANAFGNCISLKTITIPETVLVIEENAFDNLDMNGTKMGLNTIYGYTGSAAEIFAAENDIAFISIGESSIPSPEPTPAPSVSFSDVASGSYYEDAVTWAVENGITNGITSTEFGPDNSCTRSTIVTFLWRAAGEPSPQNKDCSFTDLDSSAYYYDAVLWAVENEITNGTSETTFSPDDTVTRGQAVTFLYRYAGSPAVSGNSGFTDVATSAYFAPAVQWAVMSGITNGTSTTTFSPDDDCTRAQIVTFLYRYISA